MEFQRATGLNSRIAWLTLADEETAEAAVRVLNDAPLFGTRVKVDRFALRKKASYSRKSLFWGWVATKDPKQETAT